jgi:hypothetical protein
VQVLILGKPSERITNKNSGLLTLPFALGNPDWENKHL